MQGVRTIGLIHNKIGLEPRWYIGGYNFVLSQLAALAVGQYRWKPARLSGVLTALNCAVLLDMDIAISVYQEAMLAERQNQQDKITAAIRDLDGQMKIVLKTVGGSAENLQNAANVLAANAEQSTQQTTTVAAASEEASAKGISLRTDWGNEPIVIPMDRDKLQQAVFNLVQNAMESIPGEAGPWKKTSAPSTPAGPRPRKKGLNPPS